MEKKGKKRRKGIKNGEPWTKIYGERGMVGQGLRNMGTRGTENRERGPRGGSGRGTTVLHRSRNAYESPEEERGREPRIAWPKLNIVE